jgi:GNAT superfamily N-acetyltransferase
MAWETERLKLDSEILEKGIKIVLTDPTKGEYWVAEMNEKYLGCIFLQKEWSDWRNGSVFWIHSLYVIPEFRNNGLFSQFYQRLRQLVEADSAMKGIRLYVDQKNLTAQTAYLKLGLSADHYLLFEWLKP